MVSQLFESFDIVSLRVGFKYIQYMLLLLCFTDYDIQQASELQELNPADITHKEDNSYTTPSPVHQHVDRIKMISGFIRVLIEKLYEDRQQGRFIFNKNHKCKFQKLVGI